ncbi:MAG: hypothetical protein R3206_08855, partial [Salegentibacter mishustinae]|nr:hypothetical protein [Salegentibacter mishustinae]
MPDKKQQTVNHLFGKYPIAYRISMFKTINNFLYFFRDPTKKGNNLSQDFSLFFFIFALNGIVLLVKLLATDVSLVEEGDIAHLAPEKLFSTILFIPLIEELAFRGFLNFEKKYIYILSLFSILILSISFISSDVFQMILF